MHDERINCIVFNAFNGMGDTTGNDEFGISVAWIDLDDHLEPEALDNYEIYPTPDSVREYVKTHEQVSGSRWCLAFWDANGNRSVLGCESEQDMRAIFESWESEFLAWDEI